MEERKGCGFGKVCYEGYFLGVDNKRIFDVAEGEMMDIWETLCFSASLWESTSAEFRNLSFYTIS